MCSLITTPSKPSFSLFNEWMGSFKKDHTSGLHVLSPFSSNRLYLTSVYDSANQAALFLEHFNVFLRHPLVYIDFHTVWKSTNRLLKLCLSFLSKLNYCYEEMQCSIIFKVFLNETGVNQHYHTVTMWKILIQACSQASWTSLLHFHTV